MDHTYQGKISVLVLGTVRSTEKYQRCFIKFFISFLGTGICDGDSGGSMTFKNENGMYYIRGIVSVLAMEKITDMESTCDPRQYAIFTDVAEYLPWIHTLIHECQKKVQCKFT